MDGSNERREPTVGAKLGVKGGKIRRARSTNSGEPTRTARLGGALHMDGSNGRREPLARENLGHDGKKRGKFFFTIEQ